MEWKVDDEEFLNCIVVRRKPQVLENAQLMRKFVIGNAT